MNMDKNGKEIKTGHIVKIEGGFFKADNGTFLVKHAPGDPSWSGSDYSLRKCNKKGVESEAKYSTAFWPLMVTVNSREKYYAAKQHNKEHATIEIIGSVKVYELNLKERRGWNDYESKRIVTEKEYQELLACKYTEIEIVSESTNDQKAELTVPVSVEEVAPVEVVEVEPVEAEEPTPSIEVVEAIAPTTTIQSTNPIVDTTTEGTSNPYSITFALSDIPYNLAYAAYYSTSFSPDKRAEQEQAAYVEHMQNIVKEFAPLATTDEQKAALGTELERYKAKYLQMYSAILSAQSRTMSSMITGPSNFPVRRNQKALNIEHGRRVEFLEWETKARKRIKSKFVESGVISSDDPNAIKRLETKLESLEKLQATMKATNAIIRKKSLTNDQKISAMVELGLSETLAIKALEPDFCGRLGFPDYKLTNNNATIKNTKARLEKLKEQTSESSSEIEVHGIKILDNVEANRLQIIFPGKPDEEIRKKLKSHGFRWAPSNSAWQRMRSSDAMRYAKEIVSAI